MSLLEIGVVSHVHFTPVGVLWDPVVVTCISLRTNDAQFPFFFWLFLPFFWIYSLSLVLLLLGFLYIFST